MDPAIVTLAAGLIGLPAVLKQPPTQLGDLIAAAPDLRIAYPPATTDARTALD